MRSWSEKDVVSYILGTWLGVKVFEYFFDVSAFDVVEKFVTGIVELFSQSYVYFH